MFLWFLKIYRVISRIPQEVRTIPFKVKNILHLLLHCRDISYSKMPSFIHIHILEQKATEAGQGVGRGDIHVRWAGNQQLSFNMAKYLFIPVLEQQLKYCLQNRQFKAFLYSSYIYGLQCIITKQQIFHNAQILPKVNVL